MCLGREDTALWRPANETRTTPPWLKFVRSRSSSFMSKADEMLDGGIADVEEEEEDDEPEKT